MERKKYEFELKIVVTGIDLTLDDAFIELYHMEMLYNESGRHRIWLQDTKRNKVSKLDKTIIKMKKYLRRLSGLPIL